jgi:hypothetical protein
MPPRIGLQAFHQPSNSNSIQHPTMAKKKVTKKAAKKVVKRPAKKPAKKAVAGRAKAPKKKSGSAKATLAQA